jgi:hypothetical protein
MFLADLEERAIFQERPQLFRSGLEVLLSCKSAFSHGFHRLGQLG